MDGFSSANLYHNQFNIYLFQFNPSLTFKILKMNKNKSPRRGTLKSSPLTSEQSMWVILKFGQLKNVTLVKRAFDTSRDVPNYNAFKRLKINRPFP